jgi:hypothetical protein
MRRRLKHVFCRLTGGHWMARHYDRDGQRITRMSEACWACGFQRPGWRF